MNPDSHSIINPPGGKFRKSTGKVSLLVPTINDLNLYLKAFGIKGKTKKSLYMSGFYYTEKYGGISLAGPFIGSPYAVMLLETLINWGAENIIFPGWCGSIQNNIKTGDVIIPKGSFIDEGSSSNYVKNLDNNHIKTSNSLTAVIEESFQKHNQLYHSGSLWTTDSIFRETPEKVIKYQDYGALAVEMELSALLSVGSFRKVNIASVQVVSDELSTLTWKPGFKSVKFKNTREHVIDSLADICCNIL